MYEALAASLNLLINQFSLSIFMKLFSHIQKCLNIHQLNIIKITKKDYKKARERHQSLSKEKKETKRQYGHERYKNLSEDKKQKLVKYRRKYLKMRKNALS